MYKVILVAVSITLFMPACKALDIVMIASNNDASGIYMVAQQKKTSSTDVTSPSINYSGIIPPTFLYRKTPAAGHYELIADLSDLATKNPVKWDAPITIDQLGNRTLTANGSDIIAIDNAAGTRSVFSPSANTFNLNIYNIGDMLVIPTLGQLLVFDTGRHLVDGIYVREIPRLIFIDLATQTRSLLTTLPFPDKDYGSRFAKLAYDPIHDRIFAINHNHLYEIDIPTAQVKSTPIDIVTPYNTEMPLMLVYDQTSQLLFYVYSKMGNTDSRFKNYATSIKSLDPVSGTIQTFWTPSNFTPTTSDPNLNYHFNLAPTISIHNDKILFTLTTNDGPYWDYSYLYDLDPNTKEVSLIDQTRVNSENTLQVEQLYHRILTGLSPIRTFLYMLLLKLS